MPMFAKFSHLGFLETSNENIMGLLLGLWPVSLGLEDPQLAVQALLVSGTENCI